jgi:hypothetical protein
MTKSSDPLSGVYQVRLPFLEVTGTGAQNTLFSRIQVLAISYKGLSARLVRNHLSDLRRARLLAHSLDVLLHPLRVDYATTDTVSRQRCKRGFRKH